MFNVSSRSYCGKWSLVSSILCKCFFFQAIHDERLDSRVDSMLEEGLIDELLDFHARHNQNRIQDGKYVFVTYWKYFENLIIMVFVK